MSKNVDPLSVVFEYSEVLHQLALFSKYLEAATRQAVSNGETWLAQNYVKFSMRLMNCVGQPMMSSLFLEEVIIGVDAYPSNMYWLRHEDYFNAVANRELRYYNLDIENPELFATVDGMSETLFQKVMLTASRALAAQRKDICRELICNTDAAYMSAWAMLVLSDIQVGILSEGKAFLFAPNEIQMSEDDPLISFAECDGASSKYFTKSFVFARVDTNDQMQHGTPAKLANTDGHFYRCGSKEACKYILNTVEKWNAGVKKSNGFLR